MKEGYVMTNCNDHYQVKEKAEDKRKYTRENYLHNGTKTQNQYAKNSFNTTIEEPALNESGIIAKKNGY